MHTPVLLEEMMQGLDVHSGGKYIDATFGEGGHTRALLEKGALVLAIDRDIVQIQAQNSNTNKNLTLKQGNFSDIVEIAKSAEFSPVDGIIFDLGLSNEQLRSGGKGLSYKNFDETLDMRLDENCEMDAETILRQYTEKEMINMFMHNAEETLAIELSKRIALQRVGVRPLTVGWLVEVVNSVAKNNPRPTMTRVFQALRVEVNNEFNNLEKALVGAVSLLAPQGKIAVISFHSLEDRIVKRFIRSHGYVQLGKKPIFGDKELRFERSAVLRIFSL
ncbi:MAG: 16S rRNA (cytosine(1402)-N(4))-methyltransferase RsmH [Microgenomates group bacterium]